jgi:hypothetical protein
MALASVAHNEEALPGVLLGRRKVNKKLQKIEE